MGISIRVNDIFASMERGYFLNIGNDKAQKDTKRDEAPVLGWQYVYNPN